MEPNKDKPFLPAKVYNAIKYIVTLLIPSLTTLYLGLSGVWDLPEPVKVGTTLGLIATFLGTLIGISKIRYDNSDARFVGETYVGLTEAGPKRVFNVTKDVEDFAGQKEMTFKVVDPAA